jgi:hypothetical protein
MNELRGVTFDVADTNGTEWTILRIVCLLIEHVLTLQWHVDVEMAPGPAASRARSLSEGAASGAQLVAALAADPQLIEGEITGVDETGAAQLRIEAIDGVHWDVYAVQDDALSTLTAAIAGCRRLED